MPEKGTKRVYEVRRMGAVDLKDGRRVILNNSNVNRLAGQIPAKKRDDLVKSGALVERWVPADEAPPAATTTEPEE